MTKKYMVVKTNPSANGIQLDNKAMVFGEKTNAFEVNDPGLAREIEAQHGFKGQDVVVFPHDVDTEPGHRYTFGQMPEMPWKKGKTNE